MWKWYCLLKSLVKLTLKVICEILRVQLTRHCQIVEIQKLNKNFVRNPIRTSANDEKIVLSSLFKKTVSNETII